MFDSDEDKLIYLAGCALTGAASAPADIGKITRQAYGIAEEMLALINKLKQTPEQAQSGSTAGTSPFGRQTVTGIKAAQSGSSGPDQPITGPLSVAGAENKSASESKTLVVAKVAHELKAARDEKLTTAVMAPEGNSTASEDAGVSMKPAVPEEAAAKDIDAREITAKVAAAKESIAKELAAKAAANGSEKNSAAGSGNGKAESGLDSTSVVESSRVEELSKTHDKGWNYTPWGRS